jgi:hypothetical protein
VSAVQQARAVKYLREQITAVTAALSNGGLTAFGGQFSSNQLLGLEQRSYARQVQSKKDRF